MVCLRWRLTWGLVFLNRRLSATTKTWGWGLRCRSSLTLIMKSLPCDLWARAGGALALGLSACPVVVLSRAHTGCATGTRWCCQDHSEAACVWWLSHCTCGWTERSVCTLRSPYDDTSAAETEPAAEVLLMFLSVWMKCFDHVSAVICSPASLGGGCHLKVYSRLWCWDGTRCKAPTCFLPCLGINICSAEADGSVQRNLPVITEVSPSVLWWLVVCLRCRVKNWGTCCFLFLFVLCQGSNPKWEIALRYWS